MCLASREQGSYINYINIFHISIDTVNVYAESHIALKANNIMVGLYNTLHWLKSLYSQILSYHTCNLELVRHSSGINRCYHDSAAATAPAQQHTQISRGIPTGGNTNARTQENINR